MERPVTFLQSLLVLVVAIQVIFACKCYRTRTIEEAICDNDIFVMATPLAKAHLNYGRKPVHDLNTTDYYTNYTIHLNAIYHAGKNNYQVDHNYSLIVDKHCGFVLELGIEYYISGAAGAENSLESNICDFVEPVRWEELSHEEFEIKNDLLTGQTEAKCEK